MRSLLVQLTQELPTLLIDRGQFFDIDYERPAPESGRSCQPTLPQLGHVISGKRAGKFEPERRSCVVQVVGHFLILANACPNTNGPA